MGSQRRGRQNGPQILRLSDLRGTARQRLFPAIPSKPSKAIHSAMRMQMEPRRPFDPLYPTPIEPIPSPLRPPTHVPRNDESMRILKEILDRLTGIETRLKTIEEQLKARR